MLDADCAPPENWKTIEKRLINKYRYNDAMDSFY